jgi:predicted transcriptional regulator
MLPQGVVLLDYGLPSRSEVTSSVDAMIYPAPRLARERAITVISSVASCAEITARALDAFAGQAQGNRISFASTELLWQVLGPKRLAILRAMAGQGGLSIREIARRVGRDVKAVHGDVHALLDAGLLDRTDEGLITFPYDAVRVEFDLIPA